MSVGSVSVYSNSLKLIGLGELGPICNKDVQIFFLTITPQTTHFTNTYIMIWIQNTPLPNIGSFVKQFQMAVVLRNGNFRRWGLSGEVCRLGSPLFLLFNSCPAWGKETPLSYSSVFMMFYVCGRLRNHRLDPQKPLAEYSSCKLLPRWFGHTIGKSDQEWGCCCF